MSILNQFHHQIYGEKSQPKLVFLHGLMGFGANWRKIVSAFDNDFNILTYDQRGHGRSIKPPSGYAPEDFANDLLEIIDDLTWEKIHLVGHSMGGRNAMNFSARFPHRVNTLTIEDISPESQPADVERYEKIFEKIPTPFPSKLAAKEFLLNDYGDPVMGNYFYSNLVEGPNGLVDWRFSKDGILESIRMGREKSRWDELRAISTPTLLIRGQNSQDLSQETFDKMLACNHHIEGFVIPNAGHWIHSEQPEAFINCLKNFLNREHS